MSFMIPQAPLRFFLRSFLWAGLILVWASPMLFGGCVQCHAQYQGQDQGPASHQTVGCTSCHAGLAENIKEINQNPKKAKRIAHQGLIARPGEMENLPKTCAQRGCHTDQGHQLSHSIMNQATGMIEITKKAFGEKGQAPTLRKLHQTGAEGYLRKRCISCHLGQKLKHLDQPVKRRGGGCLACHLGATTGKGHRPLDTKIGSERCFGCHSRSGRVSLTYAGIAEISADQVQKVNKQQHLLDGRPIRLLPADVHFRAGMECVDCHTALGLMGGSKPAHRKGEQRDINCMDCHDQKAEPPFRTLRFKSILPRLQQEQGKRRLSLKLQGKKLKVQTISKDHSGYGHERLSCDACHSTWAPQCYGCHVSYNPKGKQFDHLLQKTTLGRWEETGWGFEAGLPSLGVFQDQIVPFVPGMIGTLQIPGKPNKSWNYFSPLSPHSTGKARSCQSCHHSDAALAQQKGEARHSQKPELSSPKAWSGESLQSRARALNESEVKKNKRGWPLFRLSQTKQWILPRVSKTKAKV